MPCLAKKGHAMHTVNVCNNVKILVQYTKALQVFNQGV